MQEIHLIPHNDGGEHELSTVCPCAPEMNCPTDETVIITHYAYDHRNKVEDLVEELCVELNYGNWGIYIK